MPVEFLSDEQVAAYGRFDGVPSRPELERFFFLDDADLDLIAKRRSAHNQLGFALQLGTVRYLGTFLPDPLAVPWPVVDYLAAQLGIDDPSVVKRYTERLPTQHEHGREIRDLYGFRDFSDPGAAAGLREFVAGRAWTHTEGQLALFNQSVAWLRRQRVLLPGASVLARLVASVREDAADRMHRTLAEAAAGADPEMPGRLLGLLQVVDGQRFSELERLRRSPTRTSGKAMTAALDRVSDVLSVGARTAVTPTVPPSRLVTLARYGLTAKAPAIKLLAEPRRTATLLATAQALETAAVDDALDLFDVLMATRLISAARRSSASERLAWMPRLEKASVTLARTARALLAALDEAGAHAAGHQRRPDDGGPRRRPHRPLRHRLRLDPIPHSHARGPRRDLGPHGARRERSRSTPRPPAHGRTDPAAGIEAASPSRPRGRAPRNRAALLLTPQINATLACPCRLNLERNHMSVRYRQYPTRGATAPISRAETCLTLPIDQLERPGTR